MTGKNWTIGAAFMLALTAATFAQNESVNGAIYTTVANGTDVNANIYDAKEDVYLNGGPQRLTNPGLRPDGRYYFQVTDPSGKVLLSTDHVTCRQVVVSGGRIVGVPTDAPPVTCTTGWHALGTFNGANGEHPVQLFPYLDTPNRGGEYKAWVTPVDYYDATADVTACRAGAPCHGFVASSSKTDNFKVKRGKDSHLTVCKFEDKDSNGVQDQGEPFIPGWPITATGVDGGSDFQTGPNGCVTFTYSGFTNGNVNQTQRVTLTETTIGSEWTQTAPADGTDLDGVFTVALGVISVDLVPGDELVAPSFGNHKAEKVLDNLVVTKTAFPTYTKTYTWTIAKSVEQASLKTAGAATANYTVTVGHDRGTTSNHEVTGDITVSNSNPTPITGVNVTDAVDNGATACTVTDGTNLTIPANGSVVRSYTCSYGALPAAGINTATADGLQGSSGTAAVDFAFAVVVPVDGSVNITDSLGGSLGRVSVDDANPTIITYPVTFNDQAGTCTTHPNTATITETGQSAHQSVEVCVGADLAVSKTAVPSFTRTYNWKIGKTVDTNRIAQAGLSAAFNYTVTAGGTAFTDSAWQVNGQITVSNPNTWEAITLTSLSDDNPACVVDPGPYVVPAASAGSAGTLAVNYSCTATGASGTNGATATWDNSAYLTPRGTASGSADFAFTTPTTRVNQTITVTDTFNGTPTTLGTLTATDSTPYTSASYTYANTVTGVAGTCTTANNTATTGLTGIGQSAAQAVQLCVGANLIVSKTAVASFNSAITKAVDKTRVEQAGGSATFNYTVVVTESGWTVNGNITVRNPNDWQSITANVSDELSGCSVTGGGSVTVGPSGLATLPYNCTFGSAPSAASGSNMATASWNEAAASTPNGSASGSAGYSFSPLTVTDTFNGTPTSFGPIAGNTASTTFTYFHTVTNGIGSQCTAYNNRAVIDQTGASASQSVNICNTATGGLTMGFWQNRNGQSLISGTNQTVLAAYLRQYAPFANLTTPITTYVTNVIKAANASGASMNAMLKAQMLATALDVYFGGGPGGNPLNAATPIGSVKIDLTMVNKAIGSAFYENTSSSFGGATTLTVSQLLSYAASRSNLGGSVWYAQVKSGLNSQELAKDTFDAINNQVAWIAP